MGKLRVGVIGAGYWGPNLVRNFMIQSEVEVAAVADLQESRRRFITDRYPTVQAVAEAKKAAQGIHRFLQKRS